MFSSKQKSAKTAKFPQALHYQRIKPTDELAKTQGNYSRPLKRYDGKIKQNAFVWKSALSYDKQRSDYFHASCAFRDQHKSLLTFSLLFPPRNPPIRPGPEMVRSVISSHARLIQTPERFFGAHWSSQEVHPTFSLRPRICMRMEKLDMSESGHSWEHRQKWQCPLPPAAIR